MNFEFFESCPYFQIESPAHFFCDLVKYFLGKIGEGHSKKIKQINEKRRKELFMATPTN